MKVIAGVDGSKYGRWATEWIAQLSFASSPQVTALHVVTLYRFVPHSFPASCHRESTFYSDRD